MVANESNDSLLHGAEVGRSGDVEMARHVDGVAL